MASSHRRKRLWKVQSAYVSRGIKAIVKPFLAEMDLALGSATISVSRSGASSLAKSPRCVCRRCSCRIRRRRIIISISMRWPLKKLVRRVCWSRKILRRRKLRQSCMNWLKIQWRARKSKPRSRNGTRRRRQNRLPKTFKARLRSGRKRRHRQRRKLPVVVTRMARRNMHIEP